MNLARGRLSYTRIRRAQTSDRDQLSRLRGLLWPNASSDEHAQEVAAILAGTAALTMPLVVLVAETVMEGWLASWKPICAHTRMDATPPVPWAILRAGMLPTATDAVASGATLCRRQKTGRAARGALRWRPIHGLITRHPNVRTKPWDTRLSTAACITERRSEIPSRPNPPSQCTNPLTFTPM